MEKTIPAPTNLGRLDASSELPKGKVLAVTLRNRQHVKFGDPSAPISKPLAERMTEMRREGVTITQPEVAARISRPPR
jgi:hypothetical protein